MTAATERVEAALFPPGGDAKAYAVLDGASIPDLLDKLYGAERPQFECLFRGEMEPDMAEVAPYLVRLEPGSEFTRWVAGEGWGKHWGIFACSGEELLAMRQHFRRFLRVYDPDRKPMYFRFYDPRVARVYLPTCNAEELAAFFGPVAAYLMEDEQPGTLLRFRLEGGKLVRSAQSMAPAT